jgi:ATP-dependent protease Clp ATPase subunit
VKVFLDAGRGVLLCDGCVEVCNEILHDEEIATDALPVQSENTTSSYRYRTKYHCSFCGKEQAEVARLIAMLNNLFICNGCVGVCNTCIAQARSDASTEAEAK